MDPVTISMLASTALSAGGSVMGGIAQAKAAREQAAQKQRVSREILARAEINKRTRTIQGQQERAQVGVQTAGAGLTVDSATPLLEASLAEEIENKLNIDREAKYEADTLRSEAGSLESQAKYSILSGGLGAASSLVKGYADYKKDNLKG
jgi:hypothetical protein